MSVWNPKPLTREQRQFVDAMTRKPPSEDVFMIWRNPDGSIGRSPAAQKHFEEHPECYEREETSSAGKVSS